MSKGLTSNDKLIDEKLADFTDQVTANRVKEISTLTDEDMLRELQTVVLEIHRSVPQVTIDQELAKRIHQNLIQIWQKEASRKETLLTRITDFLSPRQIGWQSASQRRQRVAVQIALAVVIILAFLIPLIQTQDSLPGVALGNAGLAAVVLILLIAGSVTAWYWWRRKK
jgi:hypothetical protein